MIRLYSSAIKTSLLAFCIAGVLAGCQPGGPSLPTRKKMPNLTMDDDNFEGTPAFQPRTVTTSPGAYAFNAQQVDLTVGGVSQGFVSLSLPDATTDSATVNLLENLKPFALTLLSNWAQQQRHGVAIDLSAHNGETVHRTNFILAQPNSFSFPLVITWDRLSVGRLATIKQLIAQVPSLKLSVVAGN